MPKIYQVTIELEEFNSKHHFEAGDDWYDGQQLYYSDAFIETESICDEAVLAFVKQQALKAIDSFEELNERTGIWKSDGINYLERLKGNLKRADIIQNESGLYLTGGVFWCKDGKDPCAVNDSLSFSIKAYAIDIVKLGDEATVGLDAE